MKVTKEQSTANRMALVRAADRLFRERGIDGVGVAEISKRAGLTHGALVLPSFVEGSAGGGSARVRHRSQARPPDGRCY